MLEKTLPSESATASPRPKRSVRKSARAAGTEDSSSLFKYSKEQWWEIKSAIQPVWQGPLPREVREELVYIARWYLATRHGMIPSTRWERKAWQKIAAKTDRVLQDVSKLAEQHLQFLKNAGRTKWHQAETRRWFTANFCTPLRTI